MQTNTFKFVQYDAYAVVFSHVSMFSKVRMVVHHQAEMHLSQNKYLTIQVVRRIHISLIMQEQSD